MLYHGSQKERMDLFKKIRKPQGSMHMCPVVVTSFEIAMIDRKYLQVRNDSCTAVVPFYLLELLCLSNCFESIHFGLVNSFFSVSTGNT